MYILLGLGLRLADVNPDLDNKRGAQTKQKLLRLADSASEYSARNVPLTAMANWLGLEGSPACPEPS